MDKKILFFDCEIENCVPDKYGTDHRYKYCQGWQDFEGMGIACIGVYTNWGGYQIFLQSEIDKFKQLVTEANEIVGFNSTSFDDRLLAANGVPVKTSYDLLCEVRVASGQPANYVRGLTRAGYALEPLARKNLGRGKAGTGEMAPKLWQDRKCAEVIDYCLNDVRLLVELYQRRSHLLDPTNGKILCLRDGNCLSYLVFKFQRWLQTLPSQSQFNQWKLFFWAVVHSDVSQAQITFRFPIEFVFERSWQGITVGFRLRRPALQIWLPNRVYRDFNTVAADLLEDLEIPF